MDRLDLTKPRIESDFIMEDALRMSKSLDVDFRKLCVALRMIQDKINELVELTEKRS
jgi:hypothetical protein